MKVEGRRQFLRVAAGGSVLLAAGAAQAKAVAAEIPPTEDLMREHGVVRRILIIYEEAAPRLAGEGAAAAFSAIGSAAGVVRRFVEGYHEKLEEEFVLPKLEKAGKLGELTKVIRVQHAAGRKLTDRIVSDVKAGVAAGAQQRRAVADAVRSFARMYAAHAAWEDTDLFPAYRAMFTEAQLAELGERFEEQEHKLLGAGGFEGSLKEVGDLEKTLGIHDLAMFTPR